MDFVKEKLSGSGINQAQSTNEGGLMGKFDDAAGGGRKGEQNEDYLDKGIDFVQERMGGGPQNNESALEQAKDEQISDAVRRQFKSTVGRDFPIRDK